MQNYSEFSQHKFMIDTATGPPPLYSVNISILRRRHGSDQCECAGAAGQCLHCDW